MYVILNCCGCCRCYTFADVGVAAIEDVDVVVDVDATVTDAFANIDDIDVVSVVLPMQTLLLRMSLMWFLLMLLSLFNLLNMILLT